MCAESKNMTDKPYNNGKQQQKNRDPVDAVHHCQVDISFAVRLLFTEKIEIGQKLTPDHLFCSMKMFKLVQIYITLH